MYEQHYTSVSQQVAIYKKQLKEKTLEIEELRLESEQQLLKQKKKYEQSQKE